MRPALLSILLFIFSQYGQACQELIWSSEEYAHNSNLVYIGLITSMKLPETDEPIDINSYFNSRRLSGDVEVNLKVVQTLKGENVKAMQIPLNWCRGGQYELGDLVVAYKFGGQWHVKSTKLAINQSIKALTRPAN